MGLAYSSLRRTCRSCAGMGGRVLRLEAIEKFAAIWMCPRVMAATASIWTRCESQPADAIAL